MDSETNYRGIKRTNHANHAYGYLEVCRSEKNTDAYVFKVNPPSFGV